MTAMSQLGKCYSLSKSNRKVYTLFISDSRRRVLTWGSVFRSKREQRIQAFLIIIVS
uniref:Uncharacterized protein n=1 Tax=Enterococcus faecium TaxID=1352 RepID=B0ZBG1_ENTFC|nr:hypothetical protein [Enterococcus faecium]